MSTSTNTSIPNYSEVKSVINTAINNWSLIAQSDEVRVESHGSNNTDKVIDDKTKLSNIRFNRPYGNFKEFDTFRIVVANSSAYYAQCEMYITSLSDASYVEYSGGMTYDTSMIHIHICYARLFGVYSTYIQSAYVYVLYYCGNACPSAYTLKAKLYHRSSI